MSVIRTSRQQDVRPISLLADLLRQPAPRRARCCASQQPRATPAAHDPEPPPRYRVLVYELRDGTTTELIDVYGSGFITAVATHFDGDDLDVHFAAGGPRRLQTHIAAAVADEHSPRRKR